MDDQSDTSISDLFRVMSNRFQLSTGKFRDELHLLERVHGLFSAVHSKIGFYASEEERIYFAFIASAHAAFVSAANLAMSGAIVECACLLRNSLECGLYVFYIKQSPERLKIWCDREIDRSSWKKARGEFSYEKLRKELEASNSELALFTHRNYEVLIDHGAHPNPAGLNKRYIVVDGEQLIHFFPGLREEGVKQQDMLILCSQVGLNAICIVRESFLTEFEANGLEEQFQSLFSELAVHSDKFLKNHPYLCDETDL